MCTTRNRLRPAPLRWMQIANLEIDAHDPEAWRQQRDELCDDLLARIKLVGPPDLIMLAGNLTKNAAAREFTLLDELIEKVHSELHDASPVWLATPGPTDMSIPRGTAALRLAILNAISRGDSNPQIRDYEQYMWGRRDARHIEQLFHEYLAWHERTIVARLEKSGIRVGRSFFPGDITIKLSGANNSSVQIIVHNSAWATWGSEETSARLPRAQLEAMDAPRRQVGERSNGATILFTHHGYDRLDKASQTNLTDAFARRDKRSPILQVHASGARKLREHSVQSLITTNRAQHTVSFLCGLLNEDGQVFPAQELPPLDWARYCEAFAGTTPKNPSQPPTTDDSGTLARRYVPHHYNRRPARRGHDAIERYPIADALRRYSRVLFVGEAGAGKSTLLSAMCLAFAEIHLERDSSVHWRDKLLNVEQPAKPLFPVLLRATELENSLTATSHQDSLSWIARYVVDRSMPGDDGHKPWFCAYWQTRIGRGEVVFLVDGLDEIASPADSKTIKLLRALSSHAGECKFIVCCRPLPNVDKLLAQFERLFIAPFSYQDIRSFIRARVAIERDPYDEAYRSNLSDAILHDPEYRRLARRPAMLEQLYATYVEGTGFSRRRAQIYERTTTWLMDTRANQREETHVSCEQALLYLSRIALVCSRSKAERIDLGDALDACEVIGSDRKSSFTKWLSFESVNSGILGYTSEKDVYQFLQPSLIDYLAARELARIPEESIRDQRWQSVRELFLGCILQRAGAARLVQVVGCLFDQFDDTSPPEQPALAESIAIGILGVVDPEVLELSGERAEIWEQIGRARPDIYGLSGSENFTIDQRMKLAREINRADPPQRCSAPLRDFVPLSGDSSVAIAPFPITVAQFAEFVDEGGYESEEFWDDGGPQRGVHEWKHPGRWRHQKKNEQCRPVTDISYYEASAYCKWRSKLSEGVTYRLPSVAEWRLAYGTGHHQFPWGDQPADRERVNANMWIKAPTPVGLYPRGRAMLSGQQADSLGFGCAELLGNVWEWCVDEDGSDPRCACVAVTGGCWRTEHRALSRELVAYPKPHYRNQYYGFRVVRETSSATTPSLRGVARGQNSTIVKCGVADELEEILPSSLGGFDHLESNLALEEAMHQLTEPPGHGLGFEDTVGRFRNFELLGRGGMGSVYRSYDRKLGRTVALKVLNVDLLDDGSSERLAREARTLAAAQHENVVVVHTIANTGTSASDFSYVVMEFIDGPTLAEWSDPTRDPGSAREPSMDTVLERCIEAGRGLEALHKQKLAHGDFKPANVMVSNRGEGRAKIVDFGLAKSVFVAKRLRHKDASLDDEASLTTPIGTPRYMAPEILKGAWPSEASDQFAFCISVYELIYRSYPYDDRGESEDTLERRDSPWRLAGSESKRKPRRLQRVLVRGLAHDPKGRHENMGALLNKLEIELTRMRSSWPVRIKGSLRRGVGIMASAALAGLLAVTGYRLINQDPSPPSTANSAVDPECERRRIQLVEELVERDNANVVRWGDAYQEGLCAANGEVRYDEGCLVQKYDELKEALNEISFEKFPRKREVLERQLDESFRLESCLVE